MKKCKWCDQVKDVNTSGYCESCNTQIRADITAKKNKILELEQAARPNMTSTEKQLIVDQLCNLRNELNIYKVKQVPYFKSDTNTLCNGTFQKLNLPYNFPVTPSTRVQRNIGIVLAVVVVISCLIIGDLYKVNSSQNTTIYTLQQKLDESTATIVSYGQTIEALQAQILELTEPEPVKEPSKPRTYTLQNGNFVSGKNFTPGTYNIRAVSGKGNVSSDNMYDGGINAIMGIDEDRDFYQRYYKNISFPEGTTLSVDGVKIQITLVE